MGKDERCEIHGNLDSIRDGPGGNESNGKTNTPTSNRSGYLNHRAPNARECNERLNLQAGGHFRGDPLTILGNRLKKSRTGRTP